MPHRTLKTKPATRTLLDPHLFALPELPEDRHGHGSWSAVRQTRRWIWVPILLSVALHGGAVLVCWFQPVCDRFYQIIDTRVFETQSAETDAEVDFFLSFREAAPRPKPAPPPTPQLVAANTAPPVIVPNHGEAPARITAPLNPLFNQRLAQEAPAPGAESGTGEPAGRRGTVRHGATSFFQIAAMGQRIVYVIDRSSSMGETGALAVAKRELCASLDRLEADVRFQVIAYNRSAEPLRLNGQIGLLPATPDNKRQAGLLIDSLRAEGGTEHLTALRRALQLQPDVVFFLTDADALSDEEVRVVTRLNQGRTVIHAIELGPSPLTGRLTALELLARDNRGRYRRIKVTPAHSVQVSSAEIEEELRPRSK
jgi:hypothetical protein